MSASTCQARKHTTIPKDIPISRKVIGASQETKSIFDVYHHARSGRKVIIGPMPVRAFLDEFLPPVPKGRPVPKAAGVFTRVPRNPKNEKSIGDRLTEAMNGGSFCPSVCFRRCAVGTPEGFSSPSSFKSGICGYSRNEMRVMARERERPNLGLAEIFFMVKKDHDPFCDSHPHTKSTYKSFFAFENRKYEDDEDVEPGRLEKQNLGLCVAHAVEACMRQFRLFYFSVLVIGTRARLFRWDRAGGIVTKAFDFRSQPELLCEFLWRFHLADPVQRGFDLTASVASQAEEVLFRGLIRQHVALQLGISENDSEKVDNALSQHYEKGKVTKIAVYERGRSKPGFYLVSVPLTCPKSVSGHATRAYWSVKLTGQSEGVVRFLKDTWRIDMDCPKSEGSIYEELEDAKVESICNLECCGDVLDTGLVIEVAEEDSLEYSNQDDRSSEVTTFSSGRKVPRREVAISASCSKSARILAQRSKTQEFIGSDWVCECLRKNSNVHLSRHTHSRIVLRQAGYSLRTFTGSRELFNAARNALQALQSAHKRCQRVHRDISLDNIILYRSEPTGSRMGLLVDWEFSGVVNSSGWVDDDHRFGTWAFMSGNALYCPEDFRHTIADDLESLFYVVLYGSVRWLPHDSRFYLGRWIQAFFYGVRPDLGGPTRGGSAKLLQISLRGSKFLKFFPFENQFIQGWFKVGYRLLGTTCDTSRNAGHPCRWTVETLQELLAVVCDGLAQTDETTCDRTEHVLEGYADESRGSQDTRISLLAAARDFRESYELLEKRSLGNAFEDDVETDSSEMRVSERRGTKRKRVVRQDDDIIVPDRDKCSNAKQIAGKRRTRSKRSKKSGTRNK